MGPRVLVTGATGFIASHTIARLLAADYLVTGTVRKLVDRERHAHLLDLPGAGERLTLVEADLDRPDSFAGLVADATYVLHMASPYVLNVKDPQRDLVAPAVNGTVAVLEACRAASLLQRVLVTSSMAAVTDEPDATRVLTEADWNTRSSLSRNPYYFSKTEAERAAWAYVDRVKPAWTLATINPFMVIGPALTKAVNESNKVFLDLLKGAYPVIMDLTWGMVDVRDVADAHVAALTKPGVGGRYLCVADNRSMQDVVRLLRTLAVPNAKLPTISFASRLGTWLVRLMSYTQPAGTGEYLRTHLGRVPRYDASKAKRELGLQFRDVDQSIRDAVQSLAQWGHVNRPSSP